MPKAPRHSLPHPAPRALAALRQILLPALEQEAKLAISLAEPPFRLAGGIGLEFKAGKPLIAQNAIRYNSSTTLLTWNEYGVHTTQYPYLGYVIRGNIDWRIGITHKTARRHGGLYRQSSYAVLNIPQNHFFLMPPDVAYASMPTITPQTPPDLQVLWLRFHRLGMQYHFSTRLEDGTYNGEPDLYLSDARTLALAETLIDELRQESTSALAVRDLLRTILLRFQRGLQNPLNQETAIVPEHQRPAHNTNHIVEQAVAYIEANYRLPITINTVAANVFVSPSYLRRIFQQEKGVTIAEYIMRFRINYACTLFRETSLNIDQVGRSVGLHNNSSFCQVFARRMGCTPSEFKQRSGSRE
jgi:AraC-like DNA-binding protein